MKWQDFDYAKWKEENAAFDHEAYDAHWEAIHEKCETLDDLLEATKGNWPEPPPLKPNASYCDMGDTVHIYFSMPDGFEYSKWLNHHVSVHLSKTYDVDTKKYGPDDVIGMDIWGQGVRSHETVMTVESFVPHAFYYNDSDVRVLLSLDEYEEHWLNPQITVLTSVKTHEVIGLEVSGLKQLVKSAPLV